MRTIEESRDGGLDYRHVDVFAERAYSGNGLIVFFGGTALPKRQLLEMTTEMRQFESVFVEPEPPGSRLRARIFTVEEELEFAGHPIIGAAAAAHERWSADTAEQRWTIALGDREVEVETSRSNAYFGAVMNQGRATVEPALGDEVATELVAALGIAAEHRADLPLQVLSTGLPYLIVPVTAEGLAAASITSADFGLRLESVGAKFVYAFDPVAREGRTWDNAGAVEDVATGSAAGPAAAYLMEHGLVSESTFELAQGRFVGRPSSMSIEVRDESELWVGGPVAPVAHGRLDPPARDGS